MINQGVSVIDEVIPLIWFVLFLHWCGDFVCQTKWMAENKEKRAKSIIVHCFVYFIIFCFGLSLINVDSGKAIAYSILNGIFHFLTDFLTSKIAFAFKEEKNYHGFYIIFGFDQLIHQITLIISLKLLM